MQFLTNIFGQIMRFTYETVIGFGSEPQSVSYFAFMILIMGLISKLLTMPLMFKMAQSSKKMQELQPKMDQLKNKYGYDERILQQKTMEFYKENHISQAGCSSCLPLIIQLVIMIALFNVIREPGKYMFDNAAQFAEIHKNFFWIADLSKPDPLFYGLPLLNAILQFAVSFLNPAMNQQQNAPGGGSMKMMTYMMPIMFFFISLRWQSALILYWVTGNVVEVLYRGITKLVVSSSSKKKTE